MMGTENRTGLLGRCRGFPRSGRSPRPGMAEQDEEGVSWPDTRSRATGLVLLSLVFFVGCRPGSVRPWEPNYDHLLHLTERARSPVGPVEIVHVYSEFPDYRWVEAPGEGVACVDDAARAALLWLRRWDRTGEEEALTHVRHLLRFLVLMQQPNGAFANFVDARLEPNLTAVSSRPCLSWWTVRAAWALAEGWHRFKSRDPAFADSLRESLLRLRAAMDSLVARYGMWEQGVAGRYPAWLVNGSGADATSVLVLALLRLREMEGQAWADSLLPRLLEGILVMQVADSSDSLYGALLCFRDLWHAWGANQMYALVRAWRALGDPRCLRAAELEARHWRGRLLVCGFLHEVDRASGRSRRYPQIAYDIRPAVWGFLELADATGDSLWSVAAGLWASWLLGNNSDGVRMYDARTGRTFDGLPEPGRLNRNAGAESTIEALLALEALQGNPTAMRALRARWESSWTEDGRTYRRAVTPEGVPYLLAHDGSGVSLVTSDR